jgi:predicted naringenin-chalcone synthase
MRVLGLGTALPPGSIAQSGAAEIGRMLMARDDRQGRLVDALFRRSGVERRSSVLLRGGDADAPVQDFYAPPRDDLDRGPGTGERMLRYEAEAGPLAARAAALGLADAGLEAAAVTHLITVSCTGFHAPGPEVTLIEELGLSPDVARANVGYMGCHGAFNGLRLAGSIADADPSARILVVAVELCSLHFSYQWDSEKLVANALFADGAAALVCAAGEGPLQIGPFASRLLPNSRDAMSWRIVDHGFEMTLSAEVPALIQQHVPAWLQGWLRDEVGAPAIDLWAVHPGGPRILDAVERSMRLSGDELATSRRVLADHGNMSSATIAFILERLRSGGATGTGVALGFGPGLMAEAFAFRLS